MMMHDVVQVGDCDENVIDVTATLHASDVYVNIGSAEIESLLPTASEFTRSLYDQVCWSMAILIKLVYLSHQRFFRFATKKKSSQRSPTKLNV